MGIEIFIRIIAHLHALIVNPALCKQSSAAVINRAAQYLRLCCGVALIVGALGVVVVIVNIYGCQIHYQSEKKNRKESKYPSNLFVVHYLYVLSQNSVLAAEPNFSPISAIKAAADSVAMCTRMVTSAENALSSTTAK